MRRRTLSEEERALWRRAMRDVRETSVRPHRRIDDPAPRAAPRVKPALISAPAATPARRAAHFIFGGGDPALDRAAASRRIPVDRVIDLHGMTQTEAHRALFAALPRSAAAGERLVIVITGKGRPARGQSGPGGVLRMRFLDWIEEAPLRGVIARVAPARPRDGGAGAFYVFLKRKGAELAPRP